MWQPLIPVRRLSMCHVAHRPGPNDTQIIHTLQRVTSGGAYWPALLGLMGSRLRRMFLLGNKF